MPANRVEVEESSGLVSIRNYRFVGERDLGGLLVVNSEAVPWLADAIEGFLKGYETCEQRFMDDHLKVDIGGPDHYPMLAIFNLRRPEALRGGNQSQHMYEEEARSLRDQLLLLVHGPGSVTVLVPPAVPVDLDGEEVAMGSAAPGPYRLANGAESYGRAVTMTMLRDGSTQEVGVGGLLQGERQRWLALGFEPDGSLRLRRDDGTGIPPFVPPERAMIDHPDADVSNLWVQWDYPFATWRVDLRDVASRDPGEIAEFVTAVIEAGETTEAMRILKIPSCGYDRESDGDILPYLRKQWEEQGGPDAFSNMGGAVVESIVAWYDNTGRHRETPVRHLELILEMDEPYENALEGFREPWPPVEITGPDWNCIKRAHEGGQHLVELEITLHSDIWFPWINGMAHPLADHRRKFDNRGLGVHNAVRFNRFLDGVGKAAETVGSCLYLDRDCCRVRPEYVTDRSIVINPPEPAERMTEDDRNTPWV